MPDHRTLNRQLVTAVNLSDGAYYHWARRSGVSGHALGLLYALDDGLPHSQKEVCEEWFIPKTTINTIVKSFREAGYLTLEAMPDRPRQRQLCLTEAGRRFAKEALEQVYRAEDAAMAETVDRFGPDFVAAFACYTRHLCAALQEGPPGERN